MLYIILIRKTYTDYNRKLQPKMNFESEYLKEFYLTYKDNLIETTIKKCEEYLGMEVWFVYNPTEKTFSFDGLLIQSKK